MVHENSRVTWKRPGLPLGVGRVQETRVSSDGRVMCRVQDERGNIHWFSANDLTEANL